METPLALASTFASKLGKDELYTFLAGLFLGLIYFLTITSNYSCTEHALLFYIDDKYYLTLFLVTTWLVATTFIFITYRVLIRLTVSKFKKWVSKSFPNGNIPANPDFMLRGKQFEEIGIEAHLWGLLISFSILLIPYPWILFHRFLGRSYPCFSLCASVLLVITCRCFFKISWPSVRHYYALFTMLDFNKLMITFDDAEWSAHHNLQVKRQAILESKA